MQGQRAAPAHGGRRTEKGTATPPQAAPAGPDMVIETAGLQEIIEALRRQGYTVVGPVRRGGAVTLAEIADVADLPRGCADEQEAGRYRVTERGDDAFFGFAATPQSWKSILFPAREMLWSGSGGDGFHLATPDRARSPYALLGVRSCDLHAIYIQDRVLLGRAVTDGAYADRRDGAFIIAVGCSAPGGTCFCVSMGTGPRPDGGFDLALTELLGPDGHRFHVRAGSDRGASLLTQVAAGPASADDRAAADRVLADSAARMGRRLDTEGIRDALYDNPDHPRWDDVASRCLACTNCTLVCPTCFCVSMETVTDLTGGHADRHRVWDSCFTSGHSHLPGGSVHASTRSRYRQWLTHKLAAWVDQFGTSGCVGCGRCITWCPAAIDITEEAAALRVPAAPPDADPRAGAGDPARPPGEPPQPAEERP